MTEFTNYKFESDGETVTVVHEANFVRRTIFEHDLTSLLKNKKLVESDKDLKKTYILKRSKKGTTFCLSVASWGAYIEHVDGEAQYEDSTWENYIIGTKKFQAVKDKEVINTVFFSF